MNTCKLHIKKSNKTRYQRGVEDPNYWKKIEQKKKDTKIKNGHEPNWNNSKKNRQTVAKHIEENLNYYKDIEQKRKQTKIRNGHDPNWHNEIQMIKTRYEKNNGVWENESTIKKKEETSMQKYGFKSPNSSQIVKQHKKEGCLRKFGVDHYSKTQMYHDRMVEVDEQRKQKEYETKKKNKSFNISKAEDRVYQFLINEFSKEDVIRQCRSEKYPFNCDFYVKSLDLYIECNFSWTHGGHQFDENNEEDLKVLNKWKEKWTNYYLNAIYTWTKLDVKKRKIAEENQLKYIVQFKENNDELKMLIENTK